MKQLVKILPLLLILSLPVPGFSFGNMPAEGGSKSPHGDDGSIPLPTTPAKATKKSDGVDLFSVTGKVVETMDSGGYTYTYLEQDSVKTWVACPTIKVTVGQELTFSNCIEMWDFKSKALERDFSRIKFCNVPEKQTFGEGGGQFAGRKSIGSEELTKSKDDKIKVEKASHAASHTVAEVHAEKAELNTKQVVVKGKVVKVSEAIMGKNWIHIQDGSGDQKIKTHNLVITSKDLPAVGDIVTVTGIVAKDKDFGGGYKYDVLIEEGLITK
jgi:hypothetical protein